MARNSLFVVVFVFFRVVCGQEVEVLLSQWDPASRVVSSSISSVSSDLYIELADDFDVPPGEEWEIGAIHAPGHYFSNPPPFDEWIVRFYTADGNSPSTTPAITSRVTSPTTYNTSSPIVYFPLVTATPGKYWVSVCLNTTETNETLSWYRFLRNTTVNPINGETGRVRLGPSQSWLKYEDYPGTFDDFHETVIEMFGYRLPIETNPTDSTTITLTDSTTVPLTDRTTIPLTDPTNPTDPTRDQEPPPIIADPSSSSGIGAGAIAAAVLVPLIVLLLVAVSVVGFLVWRQRKQREPQQNVEELQPHHPPSAPPVSNVPIDSTPSAIPSSSSVTPSPISDQIKGAHFLIEMNEIQLEREIGRGDFGVVYLGYWRGGKVAVKKLLVTSATAKEAEDFRKEATLISKLRPHTNVVQFLGITDKPELSIVTEYLENGSLYNLIHSNAQINMEMVRNWCFGIAAGMLHLHSEGLVHRDLATRNVLLSSSGQPKISDFGMTRIGQKDAQTKTNTGPLKWMAPESITSRAYSIHTDSWSFGVTLWEIVSRREPYEGYDAVQAAMGVAQGNPPLRLEPPPHTPSILVEMIQQCFAAPQNRPDFRAITKRLSTSTDDEWTPISHRRSTFTYSVIPNSGETSSGNIPPRYPNTTSKGSLPPGGSLSPSKGSLPPGGSPPYSKGSLPPTSKGSLPPGGSLSPSSGGSLSPSSKGSLPSGGSPPYSKGSLPPTSKGSLPPGDSIPPPTSKGSLPSSKGSLPGSGGSLPPPSYQPGQRDNYGVYTRDSASVHRAPRPQSIVNESQETYSFIPSANTNPTDANIPSGSKVENIFTSYGKLPSRPSET